MVTRSCLALLAPLVLAGLLVSCTGSSPGNAPQSIPPPFPPPSITSFTTARSPITAGTATMLTGVFANGAGSVDHNVGSISSSVAISTGTLTTDTTFTLTVSGTGAPATSTVRVAVAPAPITPVITAPTSVVEGTTDLTASVPDQVGMTFVWTISGGSFPSGGSATGQTVSFSAGAAGTLSLGCTATNAAGTVSGLGTKDIMVSAAPIITSFTAAPATITLGGSSTLSYTFAGGTGSIGNGVGSVSSGGTSNVGPLTTTTYTLTVTNAAGATRTQTATVTVVGAPAIQTFTAAPSVISAGESSTLGFIFTGGTAVIDNGVGTVTSGTDVSVKPGSTTTYALVVTNEAGAQATRTAKVTVNAPSSTKAITAFTFPTSTGTTIAEATHTILVAVPVGTVMTDLVPTILHTGAGINPPSGVARDFTTPQTYTVTAADGTTQDYSVTATPTYTFTAVQYTITQPDGTTIILRSRGMGSDPDKAYFDIFIEDGAGGTEAFLADPVWYHFNATTADNAVNHLIAESEVQGLLASVNNSYYLDINGGSDMGGRTYQINTGGAAASPTRTITAFDFPFLAHGKVTEAGHTIAVSVPSGTDVSALVPVIKHTGASISPDTGVAHDFSYPVTYIVTAADATTQSYVVTVTVAPPSSAKQIKTFTVPVSTNTYINEADHLISVKVPVGTFLGLLVPTITHTGASISPHTGVANNFTNQQTYTVTAADGTTQAYTVWVHASGTAVIHVDTNEGGNIDSGSRAEWDGIYENVKGTIFYNGSKFVTNDTAAHMFFTDLRTGLRLKDYKVTTIGATAGSQDVQPGYTLTRSTYTYTAEKDSGGPWIKNLGSSYPVSFYIDFMDEAHDLREMRFYPAIVSVR